MLYPELEEKLYHARHALKGATSENIIDLCKQYLALLTEYRSQLYKLRGTPGTNRWPTSSSSQEYTGDTRKAIRAALETTTEERNRTEMLVLSFTTVSGYEAVEIFNRRKYKARDDWELSASGLRFSGGTDRDLITVQEAVETASVLRREEHIAQSAAQGFKERQP